ncbi:Uncharacterised protein [Staphylococcus hyicus]|nr:Uncharacterised protein [Staphylococcus hyicus]
MNTYNMKVQDMPNIEQQTKDILERVKEILNKKEA